MTREQIQAELKRFGTPIGAEYDQSDGTSHPKLINRVGAGMCGGATVDWIRRVLTGGKGSESGNPFPAFASDPDKGYRQAGKAAALQILLGREPQCVLRPVQQEAEGGVRRQARRRQCRDHGRRPHLQRPRRVRHLRQ